MAKNSAEKTTEKSLDETQEMERPIPAEAIPPPEETSPEKSRNPLLGKPIPPVPPPEFPKRRGRPPGSKTRPPEERGLTPQARPTPKLERRLPEDPNDPKLKAARLQAVPLVSSIDQLCSVAPPKMALTETEKAGLTEQTAICLYYYGADIPPLLGLGFVLLAIALPRVTIALAQRGERKKEEAKKTPSKEEADKGRMAA